MSNVVAHPASKISSRIVGPDGPVLNSGNITVSEKDTALGVLRTLASRGGLTIEVMEMPCGRRYVTAIGGIRAEGRHGWEFYVSRGGQLQLPNRTPAQHRVVGGDKLTWVWREAVEV